MFDLAISKSLERDLITRQGYTLCSPASTCLISIICRQLASSMATVRDSSRVKSFVDLIIFSGKKLNAKQKYFYLVRFST